MGRRCVVCWLGFCIYIKIYGWKRLKVDRSIIWGASRGYRTRLVLPKSPRTSQHTQPPTMHIDIGLILYTDMATRDIYHTLYAYI